MILLRADASAKNIMREEIMGRHYLFWLRPEGLRHVFSWIPSSQEKKDKKNRSVLNHRPALVDDT
jgi:hypothetical protein